MSEPKLKQVEKALDEFAHTKEPKSLFATLQGLLPTDTPSNGTPLSNAAVSKDDLHLECFEYILA